MVIYTFMFTTNKFNVIYLLPTCCITNLHWQIKLLHFLKHHHSLLECIKCMYIYHAPSNNQMKVSSAEYVLLHLNFNC
jgi:hypothetical protein